VRAAAIGSNRPPPLLVVQIIRLAWYPVREAACDPFGTFDFASAYEITPSRWISMSRRVLVALLLRG
jgi:hypothetical protein